MRKIVVFSRRGCHLCELMIEEAEPLVRGKAELDVRDVDTRPEWVAAYGNDIPVMLVDGVECCRHQLDRTALLAALVGDEAGGPE